MTTRGMARIAMNPKNSTDLRLRANAELAQYVYPKRKALEVRPVETVSRVEYGWALRKEQSASESNTDHSQANSDSMNAEAASKASLVQ